MDTSNRPPSGESLTNDRREHGGDQQSHEQHPRISEIRRKALSSVGLVAGRNVIIKVVALLGNVAFARLLSPSNFGVVAFGLTVLTFGELLSEGGLGVGLIRRPEAPETADLAALLSLQLILGIVIATVVIVGSVLGPFGQVGLVTAIMMPALPLLALRTPSAIKFERDLNYSPLVRVEILEEVSYYGFGIATVALGAGVLGLATASVVKALTGTLMMLAVSPLAQLAPRYSWTRLRPMLGFGVKFQAVNLVNAGGLQLLNLGVTAVGGLAVLGLWVMAWRLLQIPFLLFTALWRVSFPATAQLLSAGDSARALIERGLRLAAVATGAILAPVTGCLVPIVPMVFGPRWAPVANVLPIAFFALQASGPVSVATAGYLYAVGDTSTVLRATIVTSVLWILVSLLLLPSLGLIAVGLGLLVGALVEIPLLSLPARRRTGAEFFPQILLPWVAASLAGGCGWFVSRSLSPGLIAALAGTTVAASLYAIPILTWRRDTLYVLARLVARALRPGHRVSSSS
jgi:O-antigen/teichoic acid export membrane protein